MHFKNLIMKVGGMAAVLFISSPGTAMSQVNYYECANLGFIDHTFKTQAGIVATTNRGSDILLVKDKKLRTLHSGPGAGMYVNVSADGRYVGFKSINSNSEQAPALLDVRTGIITLLEEYVDQCGQVSFANDGTMAYTMGDKLVIRKGESRREYNIGQYVNIANLSPDASQVAYTPGEGILYIMTLADESTECVMCEDSFNPVWSPDGKKLAVQQVNGEVFTYDLDKRVQTSIGAASSVCWQDDSQSLVFTRPERVNDFQVKGASVMKVNYDGSNLITLEELSDATPVAVLAEGDELIVSYAGGNKRGLRKLNTNKFFRTSLSRSDVQLTEIGEDERIGSDYVCYFKGLRPIGINEGFEKPKTAPEISEALRKANESKKGNDIGLLDIPYINQVWDVPTSHDGSFAYGYVCCAPSSSCMLLGYYGYYEPHEVRNRAGATYRYAYYSWYVGREYTASKTGYTFSLSAYGNGSSDVRGGYGFMWNNGSPAVKMADFNLKNGVYNSYFESSLDALRRECNANRPYTICLQNGTGGHVVLAFRADQQSADDGSSTWEKKGSFICHDPYGDYNEASYPNWDGRFACYDWPGYNNGKKNIGQFFWGCVVINTEADNVGNLTADSNDLELSVEDCIVKVVRGEAASLRVLNISGNEMTSIRGSREINLSTLSQGIYIVEATRQDGTSKTIKVALR